jgi:hypothetical protein
LIEFKYHINIDLLRKVINKKITIYSAHFYFNQSYERYEVWHYPINVKIDDSWLVLHDADKATDNEVEYDCLYCEDYPLPFSDTDEPCNISSLEKFTNNVNQKVCSIDVYSIVEKWESEDQAEFIDSDNCIVFNFNDKKILIAATYNRTQELCILTDLNQISKYVQGKNHRVHI